MATREALRWARIENDYKEMLNIRGTIIAWEPVRGTAPRIEEYTVSIKLRTIVGPLPIYRDEHVVRIELPPGYPFKTAPVARMTSTPPPFHPNWHPDGLWCFGIWVPSEGLGHYVVRMLRTLQFDREITNEESSTDPARKAWYVRHKESSLFPTDLKILPDPTRARLQLNSPTSRTFRINRN